MPSQVVHLLPQCAKTKRTHGHPQVYVPRYDIHLDSRNLSIETKSMGEMSHS